MEGKDLNIPPPAPVFPCSICSRTFRKEALERHEKICQKTQAKKRKVYDSSKKRIEGTEIETVHKPKFNEKAKPGVDKPKSNWKAKHEEFIRAIRAAKGVETEENNNLGQASTEQRVPIGYVQCPTCGRNFNERAADRHMPWCKDQKARNSKSPTVKDASDRLKARTKYRAPPLTKRDASNSNSSSARSQKKPIEVKPERPAEPEEPKILVNRNKKAASNNKPENNKNIQPPQRRNPQQQLLDKRKGNTNSKQKEVEPEPRRTNNNAVTRTNHSSSMKSNIMKFKERFPNHKHRNIMTDENYEGFQDDLRELLRQTKNFSREPRTVPGVRTQGSNQNGNNNRFDDLNLKNLNTGELDINWAKKFNWESGNSDTLPQIGSSESGIGAMDPWAPIIQDLANTRVSTGESSTSSDGTLPPISRGSSGSENGANRLPRFCHQCGTKYPVQAAKYCCECGARRPAHGSGSTGPQDNNNILIQAT